MGDHLKWLLLNVCCFCLSVVGTVCVAVISVASNREQSISPSEAACLVTSCTDYSVAVVAGAGQTEPHT